MRTVPTTPTEAMDRMLAADISRVLTQWAAPDDGQDGLRQEFLRYLTAHPDAASRSCAPDHITASALVVNATFDEVALVHHPKFGRWLQTGGHCEATDPSLAAAAVREATEETGIEGLWLDPVPLVLSSHPVRCWPDGRHMDIQFLAIAPPLATLVCSAESDEVRWWTFAEAAQISDDSVRVLLAAAKQRRQEIPSPTPSRDTGSRAR